jgi:hypothetical protein
VSIHRGKVALAFGGYLFAYCVSFENHSFPSRITDLIVQGKREFSYFCVRKCSIFVKHISNVMLCQRDLKTAEINAGEGSDSEAIRGMDILHAK